MIQNLIKLIKTHLTVILFLAIILFSVGGFFAYQKFIVKSSAQVVTEETDLIFDPEGPYALLLPRRDGNALVLNLKRTASYDKISYELAYTAEGIDRGVMGEINTKEKKGEYEQEILFGTCSKNVCKYDQGVENGTLTLHIQKGNQAYRMITQWHLQKTDQSLGILTSGDMHLTYKIASGSAGSNLDSVQYVIINDLSGAPKLTNNKQVVGKVYATNTSIAKSLSAGAVVIELAESPNQDSKIARFDENSNSWKEFETKIEGSSLSANLDTGGVVTVLASKK